MTFLVRLYVRTAFVHLLAALGLWAWKGLDYPFRPAFLHLFFVGWLLFLIFGVAHWMFPRPRSLSPRRREVPVAVAYGFLLAGTWSRVVAEPLVLSGMRGIWGWMLALSGWLLFAGCFLIVLAFWPRIRGK